MLLSFRVSNFRSIRDEQEFSLVRTPSAGSADDTGWDSSVGTVAGIFGANASGKSNVLKAIQFMHTAVTSSYESWASKNSIPVTPFALDSSFEREPSFFEIVFQVEKVRYQYGFRVTRARVVSEWLYAYATHRRQVWFERDSNSADEWYFGKSFTGRNRIISDLTRPTALFLSAAVANNHEMAGQVEHYIRMHLRAAFPDSLLGRTHFTREMSSNERRWSGVVNLMRFADLGIRDARVRRGDLEAEQKKTLSRVFRAMNEEAPEEEIDSIIDRSTQTVEFGHSVGVDRDPVYLPLDAESLGTQTLFALVGPVIRAIGNGDTLLVDEIDASLHPRLTGEIIRIFKDPEKNPKQAQLIFTSHDTTLMGGLLDEAGLTRDEIWLTEKNIDGTTTLYPLTDFSPRKTENLERGYLQGRYGGIPCPDRDSLWRAIKQANERMNSTEDDGEPESEPDTTSVSVR